MADGLAGVEQLCAFLDPLPEPAEDSPAPWLPRPAPRPLDLLGEDAAKIREAHRQPSPSRTPRRGGSTARGPVDRSVDAAHATNRTVGESVETVTTSTGNVVVDALTFPFRLVGGVFGALFG